jgi:hypothetical protein
VIKDVARTGAFLGGQQGVVAEFAQGVEAALEHFAREGEAGAVAAEAVTKVHANASERATRDYEQLAREIFEEAAEIDAAEDEQFGDRRGDELPPELSSRQGRQKWLAQAKRQLDAQREREARPMPASRPARVKEAKRRLEESCGASSAPTTPTRPTARGA